MGERGFLFRIYVRQEHFIGMGQDNNIALIRLKGDNSELRGYT
jgi:hypothetical protein